ncbi:MAG: YjgN family protein [Thermodesulfobacteriota bacterium]
MTDENNQSETPTAVSSPVAPQQKADEPLAPRRVAGQPKGTIFRPQFSGSAGEYFRIWIVNTFLTIITFGIYAAWAKVRTRRYFYAHTKLGGHPFDYLADPVAILKGNLILGGGLILYSSSNFLYPGLNLVVVVIIGILFPFLIYKSLRFYAHNSAFRNIRFRFRGRLKESYFTYLLIPLLIPFTLGLITPYWVYRRKEYFFNNFAFGTSGTVFSGRAAPFYHIYAVAGVMIILTVVGGVTLFFGLGAGSIASLMTKVNAAYGGSPGGGIGQTIFFMVIISYLMMLFSFTVIKQYLFVRLTNYCWHHARLGKVYFKSTIQVRQLIWIRMTNILAIIFSFGLLVPWAKIRRTRYIIDNLALVAYCSLDDFTAAMAEDESAVGDAATDFFDFEIGL